MKLTPVASTNISSASRANTNKTNRNVSFGLKLGISEKELALLKLTPEQGEKVAMERLDLLKFTPEKKARLQKVLNDKDTQGVTVTLGEEITEESFNRQSLIASGIKGISQKLSWTFNYFDRQPKEVVGTGILNNLESINAFAIDCLHKKTY